MSFGLSVLPNVAYLLTDNNKYLRQITPIVGAVEIFSIILGSMKSSAFAWNLADIGVGLLAWINLLGMVLLIKPAQPIRLGSEVDFWPAHSGLLAVSTSPIWPSEPSETADRGPYPSRWNQ